MLHADITDRILGVFFKTYDLIGNGHLETVYEAAMALKLREAGLVVDRQRSVPVLLEGTVLGVFKADLVVENRVVVEIKAVRTIAPEHQAQVINYLKSSTMEVGLLLNFGPRAAFERLVFSNERKRDRTGK